MGKNAQSAFSPKRLMVEDTLIDNSDRAILLELQNEGRQGDAAIARKLGISAASVRRHIERMIADRVMRLTAIVEPSRIGYVTSAYIGIHANMQVLDRMIDILVAMPRVHYVGVCTGRFDLTIMVTFRSDMELGDFVKKDLSLVPGFISGEILVVLETIKHSQRLLPDGAVTSGRHARGAKSGKRRPEPVPNSQIDDCDYGIMLALQNDARMSDATIARKLGMSQATIGRRIRNLLKRKLIQIVPVMIPAKIGYPTVATIGLKADLSHLNSCVEALAAHPRLHYVGLAAGRYDILLWVTFGSSQELSDFIRNDLSVIPGITNSETLLCLEVKKRDLRYLPDKPMPLIQPHTPRNSRTATKSRS